jgi:hypothetical protein
MHRKFILPVVGAIAAAVVVSSTGAAAATGPGVSVRVEGVRRTLLEPTVVHVHTGSLTRFGAPSGACSTNSAAGALDRATRHRWIGTWSDSFHDYEITSILGERHSFTSKYFWEIFVDNVPASFGACGVKLHRGEKLVFAAVPVKATEYPIVLSTTAHPSTGQPFLVQVFYLKHGKRKPIAGARIRGAGSVATSNRNGIATITPAGAGTLVLHASAKGFVRSAPLTLSVTG